jgi:DNA polymerase III epsilon subunit-like protein
MSDSRTIFLDLETTGLDPHKGGHRIIEICAIEHIDGKPTGKVFEVLVNPDGKKSTAEALRKHGIQDAALIKGQHFRTMLMTSWHF